MRDWMAGLVPAPEAVRMLLWSGVFLLAYFTLWYLLGERLRNAGLVDIGWGAGFVVLAAAAACLSPSVPGFMLAAAVGVWGVRLAVHIGRRNIGKPEDPRYRDFRQAWGKSWPLRAWLQLFLFQGLMMGIIASPFLLGIRASGISGPDGILRKLLLGAGLLLWGCGFSLEAVADAQLARFLNNRRQAGLVLDTGAWAWSRHPNYFGEALAWWGIFVASLALGAPAWTVIGPVTITWLVRWVSGVPLLEKRMASRPGYAAYAARTPVFVPRPPQRRKET